MNSFLSYKQTSLSKLNNLICQNKYSNSNRNNVLIRESQQSLQNDQEKKQNALENSPQIKQSTAFCTQKTSPRIPNKANIKQQSKLQDIFHLYNINLQNQPFPQYQMQLQQNKYQHRVNVQSSLGSSNYQAQVALNQNFNGNQNVYDPQIQGSPNQQDMQYKQSLEQITESGVESTNPTQANIPFVYADQDKIDKREKVPQNIQQMIIKQQIKTRSTSRKKGRSIASSSLGKQQKLIYLPYAQKPPTTQPSSNRYNQKLNSNNLINNQSQKSNRVVRYQTEINYTDNGNDKSTQNLSCVNTRVKTPDHLHQRKDSMESIVMGQEQVNNTSQVMQTNNSILNSHQNMVTIKSLGGQPQTMDNINSSQVLNQVCSANQSFNTISINQIANSQNNTPQRIRGANKYQNPSIIKFNNINNSNNSLVYQNDQSPIQNYNEGICFNSQTNVFLPSHRSERNETSPISNNNLGGISGSNASCRTPQTQISGMTPINSTKNYYFSLPHSNPQDKPKSALSFYKVKTIQQQDTVRRNQMTMDQFQILDTLGKGSYASVKLAVDKRTNQKIAIKVYEKFKLTDPNKFKNVRREINILSKMTHENIIRLYHVIDTVSSV